MDTENQSRQRNPIYIASIATIAASNATSEPCNTLSFLDNAPLPFVFELEPPFPCEKPPRPVAVEPPALEAALGATEFEPLPEPEPEPVPVPEPGELPAPR